MNMYVLEANRQLSIVENQLHDNIVTTKSTITANYSIP